MRKDKVWLTDEQKDLLKASEIATIRKEREAYGGLGAGTIFTMFLLALSLIALALWFGKLTIFIASAWLLLNVIMVFLSIVQFKTYKDAVMKAKKRIDSENKTQ